MSIRKSNPEFDVANLAILLLLDSLAALAGPLLLLSKASLLFCICIVINALYCNILFTNVFLFDMFCMLWCVILQFFFIVLRFSLLYCFVLYFVLLGFNSLSFTVNYNLFFLSYFVLKKSSFDLFMQSVSVIVASKDV